MRIVPELPWGKLSFALGMEAVSDARLTDVSKELFVKDYA
jgi:hypothetical protein